MAGTDKEIKQIVKAIHKEIDKFQAKRLADLLSHAKSVLRSVKSL